ncbi:MAG: nucleotidyltransferase domain-containing protein [Candidatus Woesearchaeota archaeon]|nr:nucleotidyltransferase domain-containing protein [Candidatus Woesearchaeota archaeon]
MDKTIITTVREAVAKHILVDRVYLFGSRARGDAHEDSDYDFAIISESFNGMRFIERQLLIRPLIRNAIGYVPFDVVCYTPEEYEKGKNAFLPSIIEEEGILV